MISDALQVLRDAAKDGVMDKQTIGDIGREFSEFSQGEIRVRRMSDGAIIPKRATGGAAGYDLHACFHSADFVAVIKPGEQKVIPTGIAMAIPLGYVGCVRGRSGIAGKNSVWGFDGTIDSDYRGEVSALLRNHGDNPLIVRHGDRVAQLVIVPCLTLEMVEGDLDDTARGSGGWGSTGVENNGGGNG